MAGMTDDEVMAGLVGPAAPMRGLSDDEVAKTLSVSAIDPSLTRAEVRAKLAALPKDQQASALKAWADAKVKADRESDQKTTLGRMSSGSEDANRQYLRGSFGGAGSWLDELNATIQSGAHTVSGGKIGAPYEEAKAIEDAKNRRADAQATTLFNVPGVDKAFGPGAGDVTTGTLRKIAGGVMSAPLTPGLAALGTGGPVLPQIIKGVPTLAAYGGVAGLGEGDTADERLAHAKLGAMGGAVAGVVAPPLARGVGNAVGAVADKLRGAPPEVAGYSRGAVERVSRALEADSQVPLKAPILPETMLADLGPNTRGQAGALANQPGEAQATITAALEGRRAGSVGRINSSVDRALGGAQNLVKLEADVMKAQQAKAKPFYDAFEQSQIPMTPKLAEVVQRADAAGALKKAQRLIDIEGPPKSEAAFYDYVKRGIDDLGAEAQPGTNEARLFKGLAREFRETIDNILAPGGPSSPADIVAHLRAGGSVNDVSPWAMGRYHAGEGLQFRDALEEGGKAFSRATHPDQLRADMATMTGPERLGYVYGARGQVRDTIGNAASALRQNGDIQAMRQLGSEYARDKLDQIAVPTPGAAKNLTNRLDAEAQFADTYNQVTQNSKTAARQAAQQEFPVSAEVSKTPDLTHTTAVGLGVQAARQTIDALRGGTLTAKQVRIAADAARMLVAQGADRDAIIQGLVTFSRSTQATAVQKRAAEYIVYALARSAIAPASPNVQRR